MKKRIKLKKEGKIVFKTLFFISLVLFIYSFFNIFYWFKDNENTNNQVEKIIKKIEVKEIKDNEKTQIIETEEKEPETSLYWTYIKIPLINVNFKELKKINSHTVGWINVPGTNINYPFVQTNDNEYYLSHSFDKTYNKAGWIFLDYRNSLTNINKNTIIYGHSRVNNTMFGSLKKTLKESWKKKTENHIIKISTESENSLWQIFSVYTIPTTNDYIKTDFNNEQEFLNFIELIKSRSIYDFKTTSSKNDNILTLSTCYKTNERIVVHAKLIKKEAK